MNRKHQIRGNAILVALIGLLSAVLVALINAGAFRPKQQPEKQEQLLPERPSKLDQVARPASESPDEDASSRPIFVRNACDHPVSYQLKFHNYAEGMQTIPLRMDAHDEAALVSGDMPIMASSREVYLAVAPLGIESVTQQDIASPSSSESVRREMKLEKNSYVLSLCED